MPARLNVKCVWPTCLRLAAPGYEFALLMQLPEAMVWRTGGDDAWETTAFIINVTQPYAAVVGGVVMLWLTRDADSTWGWGEALQRRFFRGFPWLPVLICTLRWVVPVVALMLYSLLVAINISECKFGMMKPDCPHLSLTGWEGCLAGSPLTLYMVTWMLSIMPLPPGWGAVNLAIWSVTLFVSEEIYECSQGSMWCWMTAFANIVVVAVAMLFDRLDYPRRPAPSVL